MQKQDGKIEEFKEEIARLSRLAHPTVPVFEDMVHVYLRWKYNNT